MMRPCYDKAGNIVVIFKLHDWYIGSSIPHRVHLYRNLTSLNYTYGSIQVDWIITRLYIVLMWKYSEEKQLSPVCNASKYDYLVLLLSIRTQTLKNVWPIKSKLTVFLFIIILFRSHSLHIQSNAWCVNKYVYIFSCLLGKLMWRQSTVE